MEPNELKAAIDKAGDQKDGMDMLARRVELITDLYQMAVKNFLAEPTSFHADFSLFHLARQKKHNQQRYYKRAFASFLTAAQEAVRAGEEFYLAERIKALKKVTPKESVQIAGVQLPDLDGGGIKMEDLCQCGHSYGHHTLKTEGFCMEMDCQCAKFSAKQEGETQP